MKNITAMDREDLATMFGTSVIRVIHAERLISREKERQRILGAELKRRYSADDIAHDWECFMDTYGNDGDVIAFETGLVRDEIQDQKVLEGSTIKAKK